MRVIGTHQSRHSLSALLMLSNLAICPMKHVSVDIRDVEREACERVIKAPNPRIYARGRGSMSCILPLPH